MNSNCIQCGCILSLSSEVNKICFNCANKLNSQQLSGFLEYWILHDKNGDVVRSEIIRGSFPLDKDKVLYVTELLPSESLENDLVKELKLMGDKYSEQFIQKVKAFEDRDKWRGIAERMAKKLEEACFCNPMLNACKCCVIRAEYEKGCK